MFKLHIVHRSVFLPYKLTPGLVEFTSFQEGSSDFQLTIYLATGKNKSRRVSDATIKRLLNQLHSAPRFDCVVRFSTAWYKPYQQMCSVETSFEEIYNKYNTNTGSKHTNTSSPTSRNKN